MSCFYSYQKNFFFTLPLARNVLFQLALTVAESASKEKNLSLWMTKLVISNENLKGIMKTLKNLQGSGALIKGVTETFVNQIREQKGWFISILLGTLGDSLLENMLTDEGLGKGVIEGKK